MLDQSNPESLIRFSYLHFICSLVDDVYEKIKKKKKETILIIDM